MAGVSIARIDLFSWNELLFGFDLVQTLADRQEQTGDMST